MMALDEAHRQTPLQAALKKRDRRQERFGWGSSRRQIISRRNGVAQSRGVRPIEHMKQRNRFHVIARHLQGASALALRSGFCGKGLAHIPSQEEVDMLLSRGRVLKRPLSAIEAIKGAQEAFGRIGGRGTPGRADGW